jgi:predicted nucleotide-binding protein
VDDATESYPSIDDVTATQSIVFVGHGRSGNWRELKEFLELQNVTVVTYETEKRLGESVKETLEQMLYKCNFAVLLHTAEDEQRDGAIRARQNVVHETGLFQGRLGFPRAIILREEKCGSFSNVHGINEAHFGHSIREVFGDVLLAIRRALQEPTGPSC